MATGERLGTEIVTKSLGKTLRGSVKEEEGLGGLDGKGLAMGKCSGALAPQIYVHRNCIGNLTTCRLVERGLGVCFYPAPWHGRCFCLRGIQQRGEEQDKCSEWRKCGRFEVGLKSVTEGAVFLQTALMLAMFLWQQDELRQCPCRRQPRWTEGRGQSSPRFLFVYFVQFQPVET